MTEQEIRERALSQAAHDLKGNATAEQVVERARVYEAFLSGETVTLPAITDEDLKVIKSFLALAKPNASRLEGRVYSGKLTEGDV